MTVFRTNFEASFALKSPFRTVRMPFMILTNPKYEIFAQKVAEGLSHTEAAKSAGYAAGSAHVTACRVLRNANVAARIEELKASISQMAVQTAGISKAWVMQRLRENAQRAMTAEPVLDREGAPTGEYTYQGNVANRALELIGKELGMFVDRKRISIEDLRQLSTEQLMVMLEDIDGRIEHAQEAAPGAIH
jgi:phage terminase small subunit